TVNCVGVMGAGIAFEMKLRYPQMYKKYEELCERNKIKIGKLWLYRHSNTKWILNFPTKNDWKYPSKVEYLHAGLRKFRDNYKSKGIESVAFPLLGASNGGLNKDTVLIIMEDYLGNIDIDVEIYLFDEYSRDNLFDTFSDYIINADIDTLNNNTKIKKTILAKIKENIGNENINTLSSLIKLRGIGEKSVEPLFHFFIEKINSEPSDKSDNINIQLQMDFIS
ncbi:MAG: macro domain-containing protein, partial [Candidatus Kapaibacterium sp.]